MAAEAPALRRLNVVQGSRRARLALMGGTEVEVLGGSTDTGVGVRGLSVEPPGEEPVRVRWRERQRVDFEGPPAGSAR